VNIVKAMVERMGGAQIETTPDIERPRTFADRVNEGRFLMERGNFQVLASDLWLVPWPNEKEAFGKLFAGQVQHVTVLMDPADPEQAAWIEQARKLFDGYQVPWTLYTYPHADAHALANIAAEAWAFPRPGVVIVPYTQPCPNTRIADAFVAALPTVGGPSPDAILPGDGDPKAEGRPLPCEAAGR
jgi:hypothetical protein